MDWSLHPGAPCVGAFVSSMLRSKLVLSAFWQHSLFQNWCRACYGLFRERCWWWQFCAGWRTWCHLLLYAFQRNSRLSQVPAHQELSAKDSLYQHRLGMASLLHRESSLRFGTLSKCPYQTWGYNTHRDCWRWVRRVCWISDLDNMSEVTRSSHIFKQAVSWVARAEKHYSGWQGHPARLSQEESKWVLHSTTWWTCWEKYGIRVALAWILQSLKIVSRSHRKMVKRLEDPESLNYGAFSKRQRYSWCRHWRAFPKLYSRTILLRL
jgi:hypothetical protein